MHLMNLKPRHGDSNAVQPQVFDAVNRGKSVALNLRKLNRVAHREPTAVLGVLKLWLGSEMAEGETRDDC